MRPPRYLSALSLCAKAGKIASGEAMTEQALRGGRAKLLLIAEDASGQTKKKFTAMAERAGVPVLTLPDRSTLGGAIGKEFRASAAVLDSGFAEMIRKAFQNRSSLEEGS